MKCRDYHTLNVIECDLPSPSVTFSFSLPCQHLVRLYEELSTLPHTTTLMWPTFPLGHFLFLPPLSTPCMSVWRVVYPTSHHHLNVTYLPPRSLSLSPSPALSTPCMSVWRVVYPTSHTTTLMWPTFPLGHFLFLPPLSTPCMSVWRVVYPTSHTTTLMWPTFPLGHFLFLPPQPCQHLVCLGVNGVHSPSVDLGTGIKCCACNLKKKTTQLHRWCINIYRLTVTSGYFP